MYEYVQNRPTAFVDPYGLVPDAPIIIVWPPPDQSKPKPKPPSPQEELRRLRLRIKYLKLGILVCGAGVGGGVGGLWGAIGGAIVGKVVPEVIDDAYGAPGTGGWHSGCKCGADGTRYGP